MNNNIFNISQEYLDIMNLIEANDGEITLEVEELLKINEKELDDKMTAYCSVVKTKTRLIENSKLEIERLKGLQTTDINIITKLKSVLIETMDLLNLKGKTGNLAYRLPLYNMFTRTTVATNLINEIIPEDKVREYMDTYGNLLTYNISKSLTLEQIKIIERALIVENKYEGLVLNVSISKTNLKDAIENVDITIENKEDKKDWLDKLNELGSLVNNISLTIK